jgi:hypothetical protein
MAFQAISGTVTQYMASATATASGYYLKGYDAGTTTPLSMATDDTGSSTLAKCLLSTLGEPLSNPADNETVFIPHFGAPYKLALYTNSTDADADTIASAVWVVDNLANELRLTVVERTGSWTVASTDIDAAYNVATGAGVYTVTVPLQATDAVPTGFVQHIRNNSSSIVTLAGETGVTINPPTGGSLVVPAGGTVSLIYPAIATDEWDLSGRTVAE